jgi:hypothetical protein
MKSLKKSLRLFHSNNLWLIYAKKRFSENTYTPGNTIKTPVYTTKKISYAVKAADFPELKGFAISPYNITLRGYLLISDLLIFDIIANNTGNRPVYFTSDAGSYFTDYLFTEGIVKRLLPLSGTAKKNYAVIEEKNLEKFADNVYLPVTVNQSKGKAELSADGNNSLIGMYAKIVNYYLAKKDIPTAGQWLNRAETRAPGAFKGGDYNIYYWGSVHLDAGNTSRARQLFEQYAQAQYNNYTKPAAANFYLSKETCATILRQMITLLAEHREKSSIISELLRTLTRE